MVELASSLNYNRLGDDSKTELLARNQDDKDPSSSDD